MQYKYGTTTIQRYDFIIQYSYSDCSLVNLYVIYIDFIFLYFHYFVNY